MQLPSSEKNAMASKRCDEDESGRVTVPVCVRMNFQKIHKYRNRNSDNFCQLFSGGKYRVGHHPNDIAIVQRALNVTCKQRHVSDDKVRPVADSRVAWNMNFVMLEAPEVLAAIVPSIIGDGSGR
jgi:hypothetical protein